jgi:hypothetical protein
MLALLASKLLAIEADDFIPDTSGNVNTENQIINPVLDPKIGTGDGASILPVFLGNFIRLAYIGGIILFVIMLLIGAVEYITAGGEKDKAASAARRITNALIGLFVLFAIFAITSLVEVVFGIDVLEFVLPTIS